MTSSTVLPETFTRAVGHLRAVRPRPEIAVEEVPAPKRLAPFAYALSATVLRQAEQGPRVSGVWRAGQEHVATGRLILLHDPDGHESWGNGTLRLVTYVTAELEADLAADPLLPAVGWSWLVDALAAHEARYTGIAGTVTQTMSTQFGELASRTGQLGGELASRTGQPGGELASRTGQPGGEPSGPDASADLELRASWTPLGGDLRAHIHAWYTLLASTAGLPPPGVSAIH
jgi:hypothetical protein